MTAIAYLSVRGLLLLALKIGAVKAVVHCLSVMAASLPDPMRKNVDQKTKWNSP